MEAIGIKADIGFGAFESRRRDAPAAFDDTFGGARQRRARGYYRTRPKGAGAMLDLLGVAEPHADGLRRQAQHVGRDLGEGDQMPLALRVYAQGYGGSAGRVEADVGTFGEGTG